MIECSRSILLIVGVLALGACAPEPGSDAWCDLMENKDKGDWTMNDAAEYAKSCIVRIEKD